MTEYFEVHERDGAARLGELRLADPLWTPALVDDAGRGGTDGTGGARGRPVLADAGSLWVDDQALPDGDDAELTVLPHRAFPAGTPEEVETSFAVDHTAVDYPSAAVVSPGTATDHGTDASVLSGAPGVVGHASAFVDAIVGTREAISPDSALLLPGVATPGNVATLAYAGMDLVDADAAVVAGTQGRYLTVEGERRLDDLADLPCACDACLGATPETFDREDCVDHNVAQLQAALATVRQRIREGRLRDYVEAQARHEQWHTAVVRELDQRWGYLEQRTPLVREAEITAASGDTLQRVEIRRFADRVTSRYRCRFQNPLVLVPCSARKPYSESQSHEQFHDAVQYRAHLVSMTSPIGVVPQELELTYPAQHYDAVVTGRWTEDEVEFVAEALRRYLERNDYPRVVAHVPDEGYREVCERVESDLGLDFEYTVADHPTTGDSISNLMTTLEGELKYSRREREHNTVKAVADYMLGDGAGDDLFEDVRTTSRYPKLQVRDAGDDGGEEGGEQLAALVPNYGVLSFTLAGARRWVASDAPTKRVHIDDFVPHGSVLAPGVTDADDEIRVGDEVVVEGPSAFAVGRARMSGPEMAGSTRGVAVQVRHVEET
jgi:archaeosine synthase